jgi:hypothetical protein
MLTAFAIAAPVASPSKQFRLSVQQAKHLKINKNMITIHDAVLYTVIHDNDLEMAQVLLRHDHIDVNLKNRWLEHFLILVAKGGDFPIANGLVVDDRRNVDNLKRSLYSAQNRRILRAIQNRIGTTTLVNPLWYRRRGEGLVTSKMWQCPFQLVPVICMQDWLCSTSVSINTPYQFCACPSPKLS